MDNLITALRFPAGLVGAIFFLLLAPLGFLYDTIRVPFIVITGALYGTREELKQHGAINNYPVTYRVFVLYAKKAWDWIFED